MSNMVSAAQQSLIQSSLAPAALANNIATSVAAKALNAQRQEGDAILQLLDSAGGQSGDPLVAKATGLGGLLDIVA